MKNEIIEKTLILILPMPKGLTVVGDERNKYNTDLPFRKCNKVMRAIRRFWISCGLPFETIWYGRWYKNIQDYEVVIIFASALTVNFAKYIRKKTNIRIIYWYWNKVNKKTLPETLPDYVEKWTFNPEDSTKYNMKLNIQYYSAQKKIAISKPPIDVFFLGHESGRKEKIQLIKEVCDRKNISNNFIVIPDGEEGISYTENLQYINACKAIVEINQKEQSGYTLRAMEALFWGKKLITDNKRIMQEPFYTPDNIFVIGVDELEKIVDFLNIPFDRNVEKYKADFGVNSWFERFFYNVAVKEY